MRSLVRGALFAGAVVATRTAMADHKAVCLDASSKAQSLRDAHMLLEAREKLRVCAAAGCPAVVQTDCATWLAEVETALPTVVVTAKTGAGVDLVDVKVSVDGQPLVTQLDGHAVPMNAGPHTFHFEAAAGMLDQRVVIREGEKNQPVAVVLGAPPVPAPPPEPPTPAPAPAKSPTGDSGGPLRTVGWVLGGVGLAGLGLGGVMGVVAMSDKSSAHCDSSNRCDPGTTGGIRTAALLSDIGWISGGVLVATGLALVVLAPKSSHETASMVLAPRVDVHGGGASIVGRW
jgi:hypothetical protein